MDSVTITVRGTDPTVSIETADQTVLGGATTEALETMVSDDVTTYAWTADPAVGTFSDPAAAGSTWTAPGTTAAKQVVTLTLTVTDIDDDMASDSVTITVPSGPTVSIQTADQTVAGGTVVELEATSRSADGKGLDRAWTATDPDGDPFTGGTFGNAMVEDTTWTAPATMAATQVVTLTLTVTPSDEATAMETGSGSASVVITVPGTDPTVSIQTEDQDVAGGTVLQLQATSADSDGTIASYAWMAEPAEEGNVQ